MCQSWWLLPLHTPLQNTIETERMGAKMEDGWAVSFKCLWKHNRNKKSGIPSSLLAALQIPLMPVSTSNNIQTPFTAEVRLISSQKDKWEECGQSDTSNKILSSSKYRLNVNFTAVRQRIVGLIQKFGLQELTTKAFRFAPVFSSHHSALSKLIVYAWRHWHLPLLQSG